MREACSALWRLVSRWIFVFLEYSNGASSPWSFDRLHGEEPRSNSSELVDALNPRDPEIPDSLRRY